VLLGSKYASQLNFERNLLVKNKRLKFSDTPNHQGSFKIVLDFQLLCNQNQTTYCQHVPLPERFL
jgi:hypothetical protein